MKKKSIIVIIVILLLVAVIVGVIIIKENNPAFHDEKCVPFTGGGYTLHFETNGGEKLESIHVCIACSPDSYESVPIPTKENDTFEGWYYDKTFKEKMKETSTKDITPVPKKNSVGCIVGHKDITLYAKWKSSKVTTEDKNDGEKDNKIESSDKQSSNYYCADGSTPSNGKCTSTEEIQATMRYSCDDWGVSPDGNKCHTGKTLPATSASCPANSTYMVVLDSCIEVTNDDADSCSGYYDQDSGKCTIDYGRPSQFSCDGEASGWQLVNNSYCEEILDAKVVYSCPNGYTLNGTKCSKTTTTKALKR